MDTDRTVVGEMSLQEKMHLETAQISWRELQRFFAQGKVLWVDARLDLVQTAIALAEDNTSALEPLIAQQQLEAPDNDQARRWYESDAVLWSVVVAPYVLVQECSEVIDPS